VFTSLFRAFLGDALCQEKSLCQASKDYFETVLVQNEVITTIEESLDYVGHQVTTARAIDGLMGEKAADVIESISSELVKGIAWHTVTEERAAD